MIYSATTIALVPQLKKGPWIFWENLELGMAKSARLGFDGIELFTPDAKAVESSFLQEKLEQHHLKLAAVGTGAGKVLHGWTLTDPDPHIRRKAISFIAEMIAFGAQFGAPAIIGSMQGNVLPDENRELTLSWLKEALEELGGLAGSQGVHLIYEPLNRYETNLLNTLDAGSEFLSQVENKSIRLLADLFHMNIEETDLAASILKNGKWIGHVHLADSHRGPMGSGHTNMDPIAAALKKVKYAGFVSAEAFPWPDSDQAAELTIQTFHSNFR